jgi:hypothetical protein
MGHRRSIVRDGCHHSRHARHLGRFACFSPKGPRLAIIRYFLGFRHPSGTLRASWSLFRCLDESFRRSANGDHRSVHHSVWSGGDHIRENGLAVLHFLGSTYRRGNRPHGHGFQCNRRHEMVRQASRTCDGNTVSKQRNWSADIPSSAGKRHRNTRMENNNNYRLCRYIDRDSRYSSIHERLSLGRRRGSVRRDRAARG